MIFRLFLLFFLSIANAHAADSPFIINDIEAYAEEENEVIAEQSAADLAKQKGLVKLFERLLTSSQFERMKSLNTSKFDACLNDYSYTDHRITSTSFMAKFQLLFVE